jgi:hypothetical protein
VLNIAKGSLHALLIVVSVSRAVAAGEEIKG